jgi:DNA-binding transcriptional MerR regulator
MAYTVKKLSELSKVTIRTLHFYEEEELLKPAYYGENGYRYYGERELLQLQQILFFKELGFTIKEIKKVLGKSDFDQLSALYSHQKSLRLQQEKTEQLLLTIDKTIKHLKGTKKMKEQEIFDGFNIKLVKKAPSHASYAAAEELVAKSTRTPTKNVEDVEKRGKAFYENATETANSIFKELARFIEEKLTPNSPEVQRIIKKHHCLADQIQYANREVYKAMAQLYQEHPEFKKQLDPFHPKLSHFMAEGMIFFANKELT